MKRFYSIISSICAYGVGSFTGAALATTVGILFKPLPFGWEVPTLSIASAAILTVVGTAAHQQSLNSASSDYNGE